MLILLFAALSILMLLTVDLLSYKLGRKGWFRFASTFLLLFAQIIATEFVLGLLYALTQPNLVVTNVAVSAVIVCLLVRRFGTGIFKDYFASTWGSVTGQVRSLRKDPLFVVLLLLALGLTLGIVFLGVIFHPMDYDGNSYRLTFVANAIQSATFFDPQTSLPWIVGYPKGGEFIQLWNTIIIDNDMFADLSQIPFLILGIYALYNIAVRLGADKRQARFAALLFLFLPVVLNQLKTTYVDVMLSSLFFSAIALVIKGKLGKLDLVLIGIAFSLIISMKSTGFLFVAVLAPFLLWKLYKAHGKKIKSYIQPLVLVAAPVSFGLYWYVKSWILYGSPIYPFGFKLGGFSIFPGPTFQEYTDIALSQTTSLPEGCLQKIWFVWTEQKDWNGCMYNYDTNYAGFGPIWFIILVPAIILTIYYAIKKRNYLFLFIGAAVLAVFVVYPANFYPRYTMFIGGIGIVALALVLTYIRKISAALVKTLTILLALVVLFTNFVLCNFAPITVKQQLIDLRDGNEPSRVYSNFPGPAYSFIRQRINAGDVVAYDSRPFFIYPLWNHDYSNDVLYVTADDEEAWYRELQKKSVDFVFTTHVSKEHPWAESKLNSIYEDDLYEVYEVR